MRITIGRGMVLTGAAAGTLLAGLWADAAPRRQDEPAAPTATKEHRLLRQSVGVWEVTGKTFMPGPDGNVAEAEARGIEVNRMMPGGLWAISNFNGDMAGAPFHGHGVSGYDPQKGKYVTTWVDNYSPSVMLLEGTWDEATRTSTGYGEATDPQGNKVRMRMVEQYKDDDHRLATMSMQGPNGKDDWVKALELHYTRRPGPPPGEFGKGAAKKGLIRKGFSPKGQEKKAEPPQ